MAETSPLDRTNNVRVLDRETPAGSMSERDLEEAIRRILRDLPSVSWYHTRDSRGSNHGWPDLFAAGPAGFLWRELKTERGSLTADQKRWLDTLKTAGANAGVWRPASLLNGDIARELAAVAGLPVAAEAPGG